MPNILVIDDDENLVENIKNALLFNNYSVITAFTGKDGFELNSTQRPDLILLDLGLPDVDGLDILKQLRKTTNIPIIIITANQDPETLVQAFTCCADDYLKKPFALTELELRIVNAFNHKRLEFKENTFETKDFILDYKQHSIQTKTNKIQLSKTEFNLLFFFIENIGVDLDCQLILKDVWNRTDEESTDLVRTYIKRLRIIIEPEHKNPKYIIKIPSIGYRFEAHY